MQPTRMDTGFRTGWRPDSCSLMRLTLENKDRGEDGVGFCGALHLLRSSLRSFSRPQLVTIRGRLLELFTASREAGVEIASCSILA